MLETQTEINDVCVYISHHNEDETIVTLYTYVNNENTSVDVTVYILCETKNITSEFEQALNSIHPVVFVNRGTECKKYLSRHKRHIDITGKTFINIIAGSTKTEATSTAKLPEPEQKKIAIVGYIFYPEYFTSMYNHAARLAKENNTVIDFYFYLCDTNSSKHMAKIFIDHTHNHKCNKHVNLIGSWCKNKGRDVRPFLSFITNGYYKKYDLICKIHTKKTTYLHPEWRDTYLERLLHPNEFSKHIDKLTINKVGITSIDMFKIEDVHNASSSNYISLGKLFQFLKLPLKEFQKFSFIAGTMFWCDKNYCRKVDEKIDAQHLECFPNEPITDDGTLAHAWERAFWMI